MRALLIIALLFTGGLAQAALPIEHWTTANGARVYFVQSRELPMLDVSVDFAAGSSRDVPAKAGAASMTLRMMRLGVEGMDENTVSEQLADVGAALGNSFDVDRAGYSLRTLSRPQFREPALQILARILSRPTFDDAVLAREAQRAVSGLKEALMKPETIAGREFSRRVFGDHPYQYRASGEVETLASLTRDDLVAFHRAYYRAAGAVISIMGDVGTAEAKAIAEQLSRDLQPGAPPAPIVAVKPIIEGTRVSIPHESTQAHILIGAPGMKRGDPDYFPLLVGNYILGGGGFNSRLTYQVREKRGLTYSVYSVFSPYREAGAFQIGMQTRRDQAEQALTVIRDTVKEFIEQGPSAEELEGAKQNLIGGFPLRIDTSRKFLEYLAVIGFYGLPLDYLDRFTDRIAEVTLEQIREAFARRLDLSRMATVIVGAEGG